MKPRKLISALLTLSLLGAGGWFIYDRYIAVEVPKIEYQAQPVERGRVTSTVTASGTLSPLKTVQVGSQVSGRIIELLADFNSQVKKGDVIARIDPSLLESDKSRSKANLQSARASYSKAVADRDNAKLIYERTKKLAQDGVAAQQEVEATQTTYTVAKANVEAASAAVAVAKAAIDTADTNLLYTTIVSPIDGVVISRDVSVGQTVAASLSAPTVFTIAEDLRAMEVHTNVAESDVGQLQPQMKVTFTVDAYPTEKFRGVVQQIRNAAQTVQNVVTYDAVVLVDNDQLKLRPGMTASVTFIVEDKRDVLVVPNGALRFTPPDPAIAALAPAPAAGQGRGGRKRGGDEAPEAEPTADTKAPEAETKADTKAIEAETKADTKADAKVNAKAGAKVDAKADTKADAKADANTAADTKVADAKAEVASDAPTGGRKRGGARAASNQRTVWVLENGAPKPVQITIGISDGTVSEVLGGELTEGAQIIVSASGGATAAPPAKAGGGSQLNQGGKGGGGGGRRGF